MPSTLAGFLLVLVAAVSGGALAVPLKRRRTFELENIYVPSAAVMMLIIPFVMAALVLPDWPEAIRAAGARTVWSGAAYGFGWGVGAILFGYGVTLAGMSVGFATIMGINTAVGSVLPFLATARGEMLTSGGMVVLGGIAGCVAGVAFCGRAGSIRERQASGAGKSRFGPALVVCAISGILSSCANLGFAFTARAGEEAEKLGAAPVFATLASWLPVFWGAAASLLLWFGGLQIVRGTWRKNFGPGAAHDWLMGVLMGAIWFLATIPYGMGAYYLGRLGTSGLGLQYRVVARSGQCVRFSDGRMEGRAGAVRKDPLRRPRDSHRLDRTAGDRQLHDTWIERSDDAIQPTRKDRAERIPAEFRSFVFGRRLPRCG
jgi:L-rhamnose-H+ transport protein